METYLTVNLEKVGKASVAIKKLPFTEMIQVEESWVEHNTQLAL